MPEYDGIEFPDETPEIIVEYPDKKVEKSKEQQSKKISVNKYTANGYLQLHEALVINFQSKFVTLDSSKQPFFKDTIGSPNGKEVFIPNDTIYTKTPLPHIFDSPEQFKQYLGFASLENFDSLYSKVEIIYKKYVDVEEHYYPLLIGDTIWTWFQDKFPYTHYVIMIGDNGSGKNSALLVFKYLGYRVFYVTSSSAANYYTQMGCIEEGQCTTAEDEADDLAEDKDKRNVIVTGYCSGASIPKTELDGGRHQDNWLTYCHKWFAMEELPENKKIKAILDRSFVLKFVVGSVPYNIKDVIRSAGEPKYKPLFDELIHTRRLLFCYRLLHYDNPILDVNLNIKNRSAELTKPLIRLFQDSPTALEKILDSLSRFMIDRNEVKNNSFESELFHAVILLAGNEEDLTFTNEQIREKLKELVDGQDLPDKTSAFYSAEIGEVSQTKITRVSKSKFKADPVRLEVDGKTVRGLRFQRKYLDRIRSNYNTPDKIEILTLPTDPTLYRDIQGSTDKESHSNLNSNYEKTILNNVLLSTNEVSEVSKVSG